MVGSSFRMVRSRSTGLGWYFLAGNFWLAGTEECSDPDTLSHSRFRRNQSSRRKPDFGRAGSHVEKPSAFCDEGDYTRVDRLHFLPLGVDRQDHHNPAA